MKPSLKNQGLRRCTHSSSYFRGAFPSYGRYQWDIKYYGFNNNYEIEEALSFFFNIGDWIGLPNRFTEELGKDVKVSIQGRSGGWLVIDTELTEAELNKVDEIVDSAMNALPSYLEELRQDNEEN